MFRSILYNVRSVLVLIIIKALVIIRSGGMNGAFAGLCALLEKRSIHKENEWMGGESYV